MGDRLECNAIKALSGNAPLWVSSTKSMTGHLLGAAGAVEAAFTALTCSRGVVPPTINVDHQDPRCAIYVVPNEARERRVRNAMSNSFGFGGTNVSLLFSRFE
jgi:3-oxoacyl-[acyl-carrier-protein] synthase II